MAKAKGSTKGQLYDEFADVASLEAQQKRILEIYDQLLKKHKQVSNLTIKIGSGQSIKAVTDAEVQYAAAFKEVQKLQKDYAANEAKLAILRSKEYDQYVQQKQAVSELRKEQELRIKLRRSEEGSIEQMKLQFQKATLIISKFTQAQRESTRGKEFIKFAGDLSNAINDIQKKAGNFTNNVGRYAESLADGFENVRREIARLQQQATELDRRGDRGGAEQVRRGIEDLDRVMKISYNTNQSYSKTVAQIGKEYQNLAASGNVSKEFLEEFKKFAAGAKDSADDLRSEIKALASDTRAFDLVAGSIGTAVSSLEALTGVQALVAGTNEDVERSIRKIVAIQSVANGLRHVATDLTTKGSAANKFYAFTQGLIATATDKSASSMVRFKAALGVIGIAATVIGGIAIALDLFKRKLSEAEKAQERMNKVNEQALEGYVDQKVEIGLLVEKIKDENTSNTEKEAILKTVNEKYSDQVGHLTDINQLETVFVANAPKIIRALELKAKAQAAYSLAVEATKEEIKIMNKEEQVIASGFKGIPKKFEEAVAEAFQKAKGKAAKERESYLNIYREISDELVNINASLSPVVAVSNLFTSIEETKKKLEKDAEDRNKSNAEKAADRARRNTQAILELKNLELEGAADIQNQILSIETFALDSRLNAYQKYVALKNEIIDNETKIELGREGLLASEAEVIRKKANDKKIELAADAAKRLAKILEKEVIAVVEAAETTEEEMIAIGNAIDETMGNKIVADLEAAVDAIDKFTEQVSERSKTLKQQLQQTFQDVLGGVFDAQKNRIQDQIDDIDRLAAAEIARIAGTSEAEEKKAARIKNIEAKAAADKEALERRQRRIDVQKAIFERAFKAAQLTFEGIKTVGAIKLELAKTVAAAATNPFLIPAIALVSSQIPIAIGTTAASLVSLLATPLPRFWTGTESTPEGFVHLAEKGRELLEEPDGTTKLIENPTVMWVKKGSKVKRNEVTEQILASLTTDQRAWAAPIMKDRTGEVIDELKKISNKPTGGIRIYNDSSVETTIWFDRNIKN